MNDDYIVYLDISAPPDDLLEPIDVIINKPSKSFSRVPASYYYFQTRYVSEELLTWIRDTFKTECYAQYQIIRNGIDIHKDKGRNVAFNYILNAGGPAVTTCIYDDMYTIKTVEQIPERKWHRLKTDVLHCIAYMV